MSPRRSASSSPRSPSQISGYARGRRGSIKFEVCGASSAANWQKSPLPDGWAADAVVLEAVGLHDFGLVQVAAVEDHGTLEAGGHLAEFRPLVVAPFGHDRQGVGAVEGLHLL